MLWYVSHASKIWLILQTTDLYIIAEILLIPALDVWTVYDYRAILIGCVQIIRSISVLQFPPHTITTCVTGEHWQIQWSVPLWKKRSCFILSLQGFLRCGEQSTSDCVYLVIVNNETDIVWYVISIYGACQKLLWSDDTMYVYSRLLAGWGVTWCQLVITIVMWQ